MTARRIAVAALVLVGASLLFHLLQKQISARWMSVPTHPELLGALDELTGDERALARLEPDRESEHRQRFERAIRLRQRLEILQLNREQVTRRYELILWVSFLGLALVVTALYVLGMRRDDARLNELKAYLEALAGGTGDIRTGHRRRDTIGRIAGMIEETSRVVLRDRSRLRSLEHLASWQEAARRHAHEIRTPLTAAQMEAERLADLVGSSGGQEKAELRSAVSSILEELERLRRFTQEFTSFARVGLPQLQAIDLNALVADFCRTFGNAWPGVCLDFEAPEEASPARADPEMIRQVLVNLCTNGALALNGKPGTMRFEILRGDESVALRVSDDGPGIAPEILPRLFEPYATTRKIGEGMGLGLAISRKILLDHQGDLRLESTSSAGSTFRLVFPLPERGAP